MSKQTLIALALCLMSATAARAADETYDLRGPAPQKGLVVRDTMKFTMKNAAVTINFGGNELEGKMDLVSTTEKEETILGVDGREITKLRTKIIKDEAVRTTSIGGEKETDTEKKALAGQIVFSEKTKDSWKHSLEDANPDDKQKKELKDFDDPISDDDLFPAEKVKVGHAWDIDPSALKKVVGSKMTDAKGTGKAKFLRMDKVGDTPCAVIEMDVDFSAKLKQEDSDFLIEMKGKIVLFRSIPDCVDLKHSFDGKARFKGDVEEDGMKMKLDFSGKMTSEGTTTIIRK